MAFLVSAQARAQSLFDNPIIAPGADPSVILVDGVYYSVQSGCAHSGTALVICLRSAPTLPGLGTAVPQVIWSAPACGQGVSTPNCADIWAPQIDYLGGRWYIYYAADSQPRRNDHTLFALVPKISDQPLGPWTAAPTGAANGALITDWKSTWAIDPDVFQASDNHYYLVYSCRQDNTPYGTAQSICLAGMSDPLHLQADPRTGKKVVALSKPTQPWETRAFPTEEGPFGFTRNGVDYILYSGSFSGIPDGYSEGLLINNHPPQPNGTGNPLTNPASWIKEGPVFDGHHAAYGTASSVLVPSPDGTEIWNVYHGTDCLTGCATSNGNTWLDRSIRAQKAGWSATGDLVMGYPVDILDTDGTGASVPLPDPSTDGSGTMTVPSWGAAFGDAAEGDTIHGLPVGSWSSPTPSAISSTSLDPNRFDQEFFGANPNWQDYVLYTQVRLLATGTGDPHPKYGVYAAYVDHNNYFLAMIDVTSCGKLGCLTTDAVVHGADQGFLNCPLPAGFNANVANTLTVEAVNGAFTVLLNGTALTGACQSRQYALNADNDGQGAGHGSNGQVGVVVQNTKAEYSNFTVSPGVPLDSQKFSQTYAFQNQTSRMNLDNSCDGGCGSPASENVPVIQYPPAAPYPLTTSQTQLWKLQDQGNGSFTIVSALSGMCLDDLSSVASSKSTQPQNQSATLQQNSCDGRATQNWSIMPQAAGYFTIRNQVSSLVLDSSDATQGTPVRLTPANGASSQRWLLVVQ